MTARVDEVCYRDAYARSAEARVLEVAAGDGPPLVVLDTTGFYPGGGGQPSDRGLILRAADGRAWTVKAARRIGGEIVHELEPSDDGELPAAGDLVRVDVEWARRYALMRTHTALHTLCGVVWRDYGALVTGGNMEPGTGRMDFEFETMSGDLVGEIEAKVNEELRLARDVRVQVLPRDEAFAIPDLIRTKVNLLPRGHRADPHDRDRRAWTCRPTAGPTWRTPVRSAGSASPATSPRAASTSGSASR